MIEPPFFAIEFSRVPGALYKRPVMLSDWEQVETYADFRTARNRAQMMLKTKPELLGQLRLTRCHPLPAIALDGS